MIGAGSTVVASEDATSPTAAPTSSNTAPNSRSSPQRTMSSVSPDMSHVSVIVVGGVGDNDSIHVIDSSLPTASLSQQDTSTIDQVIERSYSSASHSSNASSIGTGLSISSGSNSAALNTKNKFRNLREEDEQSFEQTLRGENDGNIDNRGPSQNSLRVEGTTIDETEEDMIEDPSSYNHYNDHISSNNHKFTEIQQPIREESEEDSGMIDDVRLGKISDDVVSELPFDSPIKLTNDVSIMLFYMTLTRVFYPSCYANMYLNLQTILFQVGSSTKTQGSLQKISKIKDAVNVIPATASSTSKPNDVQHHLNTNNEHNSSAQGQHQHPSAHEKHQQRYIKTQRSISEATAISSSHRNHYPQGYHQHPEQVVQENDEVVLRRKKRDQHSSDTLQEDEVERPIIPIVKDRTPRHDKATKGLHSQEKQDPSTFAPDSPANENEKQKIGSAVERKTPLTKDDIAKMNLKKKTRKRTRKFEIDGVVVTTTTSKVIYGDEENEKYYDEHYFRKQELRELKLLQKQEQKQFQDLTFKNAVCREQQDKRFEQERGVLIRNYENDLQSMVDQQRKQVDRAEEQQHVDVKVTSKKIRAEQEKELKSFRESLKTEVKLLKQEVELLPKERRKEELKHRKEGLEGDQQRRVC